MHTDSDSYRQLNIHTDLIRLKQVVKHITDVQILIKKGCLFQIQETKDKIQLKYQSYKQIIIRLEQLKPDKMQLVGLYCEGPFIRGFNLRGSGENDQLMDLTMLSYKQLGNFLFVGHQILWFTKYWYNTNNNT